MTGSTVAIDFPSSWSTNSIDDHDDVDHVGMLVRDRDDKFDKLKNLNMDLEKKRIILLKKVGNATILIFFNFKI